jgi:DNA-binding SARP family transcriptional activator
MSADGVYSERGLGALRDDDRDVAARGQVGLRVLSGFEVWVGDQHVPVTSNVERLLGLLAVRRRPQNRLSVASTLWMDTTEIRATANLRTALWKARQVLGGFIEVQGNHLALSPRVDVDLTAVLTTAHRLLDGDAELCPEDLDTGLLSGELLPGWDEEWILYERERLRQLCIHALEALCRRLSEAGQGGRAVDAGLAAVASEPLRESAQQALIAAHLAEGNVSEARRQYQAYRTLLWDSLGIEPSDALRSLVGLRMSEKVVSSSC